MDSLTEKKRRLLTASPRLDDGQFTFGNRVYEPDDVVERLASFLTDERAARIEQVLDGRTYHVAAVVEGLANLGNVSAVMRSAEALGCQPFHIVTGSETFKNSKRTSQGSEKWLDVFQWDRASDCVAYLRDAGYRIVATHLDAASVTIDEIDFAAPTAVVFGNERDGVSDEMVDLADETMIVPMVGFVQSFNISVAAAVTLYHAYLDRRRRLGHHGDLSDRQRSMLRAEFYVRSVRAAEDILRGD